MHLENSVLISLAQTFNENFSGFENMLDLYTVPKSGEAKTPAPKPSLKYVLNNVQSIVITHGLQDYPTVVVLDNNMRQVFCDVSYIDLDNVSLSFSMFFNGLAVLTN